MRGRYAPPPPPPQIIELVATSLDEAHLEAARLAQAGLSGVWALQALHDPGCRAVETQCDADCQKPCKPTFLLMDLVAHLSFLAFDQTERQAQKARWN